MSSVSLDGSYWARGPFVMMFALTVINYVDRSSIAYAAIPIAHDLHLNSQQIGVLFGVFGVGYFLSSVVGGYLADCFMPSKVLFLSSLIWGVILCVSALSSSFLFLLLLRVFLGLSEGTSFPGLIKLATSQKPAQCHGRILGWLLSAVPFSLMVGGLIVSNLIELSGWRHMFLILACLTLTWSCIWILFQKQFEAVEYDSSRCAPMSWKDRLKKLRALHFNGTFMANYLAFFTVAYYLFFFMNWLPTYLHASYHIEMRHIGNLSMLPWAFSILCMVAVGSLSDYLLMREKSLRLARSYLLIVMQGMSMVSIIFLYYSGHSLVMVLIWTSVSMGCILASNVCITSTITSLSQVHAGFVVGLADAMLSVSAFIAPAITGLVVSHTHAYQVVFVLIALLTLISIVIQIFFHHPDQLFEIISSEAI